MVVTNASDAGTALSAGSGQGFSRPVRKTPLSTSRAEEQSDQEKLHENSVY